MIKRNSNRGSIWSTPFKNVEKIYSSLITEKNQILAETPSLARTHKHICTLAQHNFHLETTTSLNQWQQFMCRLKYYFCVPVGNSLCVCLCVQADVDWVRVVDVGAHVRSFTESTQGTWWRSDGQRVTSTPWCPLHILPSTISKGSDFFISWFALISLWTYFCECFISLDRNFSPFLYALFW